MLEGTTSTSQTDIQTITRKPKAGRAIILVLIALVLVATSGVGAYYYRDQKAKDADKTTTAQVTALKAKVTSLEKQLAGKTTTTTTQTTTACTPVQPSVSAVDNIKASITSGNTAALEGYMVSSVNVVYAASEGLDAQTPAQAVSDVTSFIGNTTQVVWSFDVSASLLSSYGQGSYSKYFPGTALVAKSSTSKVLSFGFDCNGKISTVFFAASESLLQ